MNYTKYGLCEIEIDEKGGLGLERIKNERKSRCSLPGLANKKQYKHIWRMLLLITAFIVPVCVAAVQVELGGRGTLICGDGGEVYAGEAVSSTKTVTVIESKKITDVASYDVWKHINGTWQFGKKPGSSISSSFTIYIAGRLPDGAKVISVTGGFDDGYSGAFASWTVPSASISVKSFNDKNLTYSVSTTLVGEAMNLRKETQSEYTEGYRYYIPAEFEVTYTIEKEAKDESGDIAGGETEGDINDGEAVAVDGNAVLELPDVTYEGHSAPAKDRSMFEVDGKAYNAARMYDEGLAANSFTASGNGKVKRQGDTEADITFNEAGKQSVTLKVKPKNGSALTDKKYIEVLKTPSISEILGGVQKENRRQVLSVTIAENPNYPLTELYIEIEKKGGAQRVHLEHDVSIAGKGSGSNVNDNSSLIKTRAIKDVGSDKKFTRIEAEFLTKNEEKTEMTYRIFAKDTRGNIDIVEKDFTVLSDEAPEVVIEAEKPQFRDEGTNTAYVYAEDITAYDGDDAERAWYVREESVSADEQIDENSGSTNWSEWKSVSESGGMLMDASFGIWRSVAYKKSGVGKVEFKLDVKDKWIEETLEEYVSESDRKAGSGSAETEVDNIAPVVSLNAEKLKKGNLVMLAFNDDEKQRLDAFKAEIMQRLIENGIHTNVSVVRTHSEDELNVSEALDTVAFLKRPYGYSMNETFLEKDWYMADNNTLYTIDGTWTQQAKTTSIYSYDIDAPYTINAYDLAEAGQAVSKGGDVLEISEDTSPKWQITVSKEQIGNADINKIRGMAQDDTGKYLYFITSSQTLIYDKENGVLVGTVPMEFGYDNFVSEKMIYTLKADGMYSVNMRSGKISFVYSGKIAMKKSYCDRGGSAARINGEICFVAGSGSTVMRVAMNPVTEEIRLTAMKASGASYASTYTLAGFGSDGNVCISRDNMRAFHVFDRDGKELAFRSGWNTDKEHDILLVYKNDGSFDYVAVLYNTYRKTGTSSSGYKYRYGINVTLYDVYGEKTPISYLYERVTGSGGTSGSGCDAGKAMYAVQLDNYAIVNTGNWSTCLSDGSDLSSYYNTSFVQLVFDTQAGTAKAYQSGSTMFGELNTGGVLCEYGKLGNEYVVSAYSNDGAQYAYGDGMNLQALKVARLPKTEDIETASCIARFAPVKSIAGLDKAAVYIDNYDASENDEKHGGLLGAAAAEKLAFAENALIGNAEEKNIAEAVAYSMKNLESGSGGIKVISKNDNKDGVTVISRKYTLLPDTQYFYEMDYSGDIKEPVSITAEIRRAADETDKSILTGNSYIVTEIFEEDFSDPASMNNYFSGIAAERTADGVYYGAALHRSKDSSSKNRALSDSSKLTFDIEKGKKAVLVFDYEMKAERSNVDEAYVNIDGERWYRNSGFSDMSDTYVHPHILEAGSHSLDFGVKGYGKRPVASYIDIDNLKVIYIEEAKTTADSTKTGEAYGAALAAGTDTVLSYGANGTKGSFTTPEKIVSFAGQRMTYINAVPDDGAVGIAERKDTDSVKELTITVPEDMKAVFTAVELISSPSKKHGVHWIFEDKELDVREESDGSYYPMTVPSPLRMVSEKHDGSITAKTASLYKAGAGFGKMEMVLTNALNNSITEKKYFISPETDEIYFEDEVFDGTVTISVSGNGEWTMRNFRMYYIENGKKVYVEDGYAEKSDALKFNADGGTITVENVSGEVSGTTAPIYKTGETVVYGQTYYDFENDPSKAQYWRYTHVAANDGIHPEAGKILTAPIERFYIDGKYTVEHWQQDSTGRIAYDKLSNIADFTFYIDGQAAAPWIETIKTNPSKPKAGERMSLTITVNDAEKDVLSLVTELYYEGKLVYTHKKDGIAPTAAGKYPEIRTGIVPGGALAGKYAAVCTVRDETGTGLGFYDFEVEVGAGIDGSVGHFAAWEEKRLEYNEKNPAHPRSSNTFWPQEAFDLKAIVSGMPASVKVFVKEYPGTSVKLTRSGTSEAGEAVYKGSYFDRDLAAKLAQQGQSELTFVFEAAYTDGKTVTDEVLVMIDNTDGSDMKLHRVW